MHDTIDADPTSGGATVRSDPGTQPGSTHAIDAARDWLLARQHAAGFWCGGARRGHDAGELHDPARGVLRPPRTASKSRRLARTIRDEALPGGGWSQYPGGPPDLSVSCLSYFALKVAGDAADAPHMRARARRDPRDWAASERANTYTRYHLALFGQYPWAGVPAIPPEMIFLPGRGAVHRLRHVELVADDLRPAVDPLGEEAGRARCPPRAAPRELFRRRAPAAIAAPAAALGRGSAFFSGVDRALKVGERLPGAGALRGARRRARGRLDDRAVRRAPTGCPRSCPRWRTRVIALTLPRLRRGPPAAARGARAHLDGLLLDATRRRRCACSRACRRSGTRCSPATRWRRRACPPSTRRCARAAAVAAGEADQRARATGPSATRAPPGGWYFEHRNEFYPDVDDTCMALMVLRQRARRRARGDAGGGDRARPRLDAGDAEPRRRLGQLRSRQRQALADRRCRSPTTTR